MRFALEKDNQKISISRDFRRYLVRPTSKIVFQFSDKGTILKKYDFIETRLDPKDDIENDIREYCFVVVVGEELPISKEDRLKFRTEELNG